MSDPAAPSIQTDRLQLMWLDPTALAALLAGDRVPAARLTSATVSDEWIADSGALLVLRHHQMRRDPAQAAWLMRAMVVEATRVAIGHIGFHGAPGINALRADDALELGYSVLPAFRGSGFATEAARGLMGWAASEQGIRRFLASVSPSNLASRRVVEKLGFVAVTTVWDDEDGEEVVYERQLP